MLWEDAVEIDLLVNLTGRRLDFLVPKREGEGMTTIMLEPDRTKSPAKIVPQTDSGLTTCGPITCLNAMIPTYMESRTVVVGVPKPKSGVLYIVSEKVANHPLLRRRNDVVYPLRDSGLPSKSEAPYVGLCHVE